MPSPRKFLSLLLIALACAHPAHSAEDAVVDHAIDVSIDPERGNLRATDTLTLPEGKQQVTFWLHEGLTPEVASGDAILERIGHEQHLERFRLTTSDHEPVTLSYGGRIQHGLQRMREGMGRSREQSVGTIERDGVFLSGYTGWYPDIPDTLLRFELEVALPPSWLAVSQGVGPEIEDTGRGVRIGWRESLPQDEIQLSAARFKLYRKETPFGEAQAYLRLPDDELAARYLDATAEYLERYSKLIGTYPYAKFALVENFWETGYGMPSFTLLGSRVLRLPFILHSSYPHEILHNWWGNAVYVDYEAGNWSEGLTAYLADHLNQEIAGRGADYRRDQLKAYADYVRDAEDFPLIAFRGRHSSASQAIGYGKMLMTTHMLRVLLGDDAFRRGLQRFYDVNRFQSAGFDDLRIAFEETSGRNLKPFIDAWTTRSGAAQLELSGVKSTPEPSGAFRVSGNVDQTQADAPFPLAVPIVIHVEDGSTHELLAEFDGRTARFDLVLPAPPVRLAVDPRFETFRRLLPQESPVALSNLFGAETGLMLLPAQAPQALLDGYRTLAVAWQQGHPLWQISSDDDVDRLPDDLPVWLFGWENRFIDKLTDAGSGFALDSEQQSIVLEDSRHASASMVLTARRGAQPLGWVATTEVAALPGLARKLPHYGKYGYLLFAGSAPDNRLKGQWPAGDSPLMHWFTDARPVLSLPPRPPLATD